MTEGLVWGIDPGVSGAIAMFSGGKLLTVTGLSVCRLPGWSHKLSDPAWLAEQLDDFYGVVVIETPTPRPQQKGAATSLASFGVLVGVARAMGHEVKFVTPAQWTQALKVGSDKKTHLELARGLWPEHRQLFARAGDDGRADAALIAHYWMGSQ